MYASTAAGTTGELYILDSSTGAVVQDVGPLNDLNNVNYPITGLAFQPHSGALLARREIVFQELPPCSSRLIPLLRKSS